MRDSLPLTNSDFSSVAGLNFSEIYHNYPLAEYIQARAGSKIKRIGNSLRVVECPFCGAKNNAFSIWEEKNICKCFSCGEKANVISFEKKYSALEGIQLTTREAAARVANQEIHKPLPKSDYATTDYKTRYDWHQMWDKAQEVPESWLELWLKSEKRGFGSYATEGAKLAKQGGVKVRWYEKLQMYKLLFPIKDASGKLTGIQAIMYPDHHYDLAKARYCKELEKYTTALANNPEATMPEPEWVEKRIHGKVQGIWCIKNKGEKGKTVLVVESIANAEAAALAGYSAACIFSASNTKNIPLVKEIFPESRPILLLDKSDDGHIEKIEREAMVQYQADGIFFEADKKNGYDVNDLLKESIEKEQEKLADARAWVERLEKEVESNKKYVQEEMEKENLSPEERGEINAYCIKTLDSLERARGRLADLEQKEHEFANRVSHYIANAIRWEAVAAETTEKVVPKITNEPPTPELVDSEVLETYPEVIVYDNVLAQGETRELLEEVENWLYDYQWQNPRTRGTDLVATQGVLAMMLRAGKTEIPISSRILAEQINCNQSTARKALLRLTSYGLLELAKESDGFCATEYRLGEEVVKEAPLLNNISRKKWCFFSKGYKSHDMFTHGARLKEKPERNLLTKEELESDKRLASIGRTGYKIVGVLRDGNKDMDELQREAQVSRGTLKQKLTVLTRLGMVKKTEDGKLALMESYNEKIAETTPNLTTFGKLQHRKVKHLEEKIIRYEHLLRLDSHFIQEIKEEVKNKVNYLKERIELEVVKLCNMVAGYYFKYNHWLKDSIAQRIQLARL